MSASSLALALPPSPGATPPVRRGADARAAANDTDFATTLEATAPDAAPPPSSPALSRAETPASEGLFDIPAEKTNDTVTATAEIASDATIPLAAAPVLTPLLQAPGVQTDTPEVDGSTASRAQATPVDPDLQLPTGPLTDTSPADAASRTGVPSPELATAQTARTAAVQAALTPTATPVATLAVVAPRAAKPDDAGTLVASSDEAEPAPVPTSAGPSGSGTAPTGTTRTRDVIDRAQTTRTEASASSTGADADAATASRGGTTSAEAAKDAPTAAAGSRPSPAAPGPVDVLATGPLTTTPETAPTTQAAETARIEARAAEATTLALSTTSRASAETAAQIAAQIVRKLEARSTRFEMALTPEDLGRVDVSLDIDADGQLAARLAFDNPVAATELRGRVDELRRQLQEAGFTVADDALSFTERDPSAGSGGAFDRGHDPRNARAFGAAGRLSADADLAAAPARWMALTLTPERVDMKV